MPSIGVRCFVAIVHPGDSTSALVARLTQDPRVESVQPQQLFRTLGTLKTNLPAQSGSQSMQVAALHRLATGRAVKIAQIDTGVDLSHPDLHGQLADAQNFVESSIFQAEVHGTAVAGIIVAKPHREIGVVGVAPGAQLVPLRACWEPVDGGAAACTSFTLAKAMQFALSERVRVINLSLTGPPDRLLERLVDRAVADGITVVSALDPAHPGFPGTHHAVVAVANDAAPGVGGVVIAPGTDVMTTAPGASWGFFSGSSFAAAHVSGIAALVLQVSPGLSPVQVRELLRRHTQASEEGPARLDACAALAQAARAATRLCRPPQAARGGGTLSRSAS
jgi:subtilisin family serine protease